MSNVKPFDPEKMCGARRKSCDIKLHPGDAFDPQTGDCAQLGQPGHRGSPCRLWKGYRTNHVGVGTCIHHMGNSPSGENKAAREMLVATLTKMGVAIEIDPQQALLQMVWEAYGNVAFLRARVQELKVVFGENHLGDAAPHVLTTMYADWTDRLAKYSRLAIDAGIAQKHLDLMERIADPIVAVVMAALEGLPPEEAAHRQQLAVAKLAEFSVFEVLAAGPAHARVRA
jgi:hypothetical protein